jgi:hypothetical protein
VDGPLLLGIRTHKVVNDANDRVFNYCCWKPLHWTRSMFIIICRDSCWCWVWWWGIPRINSFNYGSSLVLGKIDANLKAHPLKVPVVRDLSFHACFQLKDENSNYM